MLPGNLLAHHGIQAQRYEGQTPDADDILSPMMMPAPGRGGPVIFCRRHIGIPLERAPGNGWQRGTPHELLRCWRVFTALSWKTGRHGRAAVTGAGRREMTI
jgi:hypothetical protein